MKKNASLLITGGTGSFGNVVLKKFLDLYVFEFCILSSDVIKHNYD